LKTLEFTLLQGRVSNECTQSAVLNWDGGNPRYLQELKLSRRLLTPPSIYADPKPWQVLESVYLPSISDGTICSATFSVQRKTDNELLTPTRASVKRRCKSSTPATGLSSRAMITS